MPTSLEDTIISSVLPACYDYFKFEVFVKKVMIVKEDRIKRGVKTCCEFKKQIVKFYVGYICISLGNQK